ncbi:hypothetical protein BJ085DRAFT_28407 [Dimargaris cristalligena]|uniref:Uncharacterized protein n=1 Tax=Dimargaris cristalligena TaxID=215637 RepID=A0A4P9ZV00_9FUNG|nr:hypothetical protein BJ085DRAFT_28407 [Dimargaris cristalligena]|eukprot:RKP36741.1 hypothetical protein BJ085DRAFT_28407 [Dimargaris cristalligena]
MYSRSCLAALLGFVLLVSYPHSTLSDLQVSNKPTPTNNIATTQHATQSQHLQKRAAPSSAAAGGQPKPSKWSVAKNKLVGAKKNANEPTSTKPPMGPHSPQLSDTALKFEKVAKTNLGEEYQNAVRTLAISLQYLAINLPTDSYNNLTIIDYFDAYNCFYLMTTLM